MPFYLIIAVLIVAPWVCGPLVSPSMAYNPVYLEASDWCYGGIGIACWILSVMTIVGRVVSTSERQAQNWWKVFRPSFCLRAAIWIVLFFMLLTYSINTSEVDYGKSSADAPDLGQASPMLFVPWSLGKSTTIKWSLFYSGFLMLGWATFLAIRSQKQIRIGLWILSANFLLLGMTGCFFELMESELVLGWIQVTNASFFGPFQYHNYFVAYNLFGIFTTFALFVSYYRDPRINATSWATRRKFAYCGFVTLFLVCIMPLAGSRSGIVLLLPTAIFLSVFAFRWRWFQVKNPETGRIDFERAARLVVFAILIVAASFSFGWSQIRDRIGATRRHVAEFVDQDKLPDRILIHRDTVKMISERPVWGFGPGSWQQAFPQFASNEFRATKWYHVKSRYSENYILVCNAHGDWLEFIANLGIIGFLLLVSVPAHILWTALRAGIQNWQIAILFGLMLVGILAIWDAPLINPANTITFVVLFVIATKSVDVANLNSRDNQI